MENNNTLDFKKGLSAGVFTILKGKVSNFNQGLIIYFSALLLLIFICVFNLESHPKVFVSLFHFSVRAIFVLIGIGVIKNWLSKPEFPISTKFIGVNREIEMKNVPKSMLTKELFMTVATLIYPENEPPVGLIEGDVTDDKSIKMLKEEERQQFQEKECKAIREHQCKIVQELRQVQRPLKKEKMDSDLFIDNK